MDCIYEDMDIAKKAIVKSFHNDENKYRDRFSLTKDWSVS